MTTCGCGCGQSLPEGRRFVSYHHLPLIKRRGPKGDAHPRWQGGRSFGVYLKTFVASRGRYVREHVLIAERALGKRLPPLAVVHHHDGDTWNNRNANLVICQNTGYHRLLHQRLDAYRACGHADWLRCIFCGQHDAPERVVVLLTNGGRKRRIYHQACNTLAARVYRAARRAS